MNPRLQKTIDDIDRTKAKIAELQALLPELERKKTDLENTEIIRLVRSVGVVPGDIVAFVESIKTNGRLTEERFPRGGDSGRTNAAPPATGQEATDNEKNEE
jgi:hypothetical protein